MRRVTRKVRAKAGIRTVAAEEAVEDPDVTEVFGEKEDQGVVDAVVVAGERGVNFYS